jgi:hypothetical protein
MRNFGWILLLVGVVGFFYCSQELDNWDPVPEGKSISESLEYPAGKWEVARYGAAGAALMGFLLAMFPKGR